VISNKEKLGLRKPPLAFTEQRPFIKARTAGRESNRA
jgi:hypothetical protein